MALIRLLALIVFSIPAHAQQTGMFEILDAPAPQLQAPARAALVDLHRSGDLITAVGAAGTIIQSRDNGQSWIQRPVPVSVPLTAIDIHETGAGVAVGHDGLILRSTDHGTTWRRVTDGRTIFPELVEAAKARVAAAEAALAASEDSGEARYALEDAVADEEFRLGTAQTSIEYGPAWPLLNVAFLDAQHAVAVGAYGLMMISRDAGLNWQIASDVQENPDNFHLNGILRTQSGALLIAAEGGVIFRSTDQGQSFARYESAEGTSLFGLAALPGAPDTLIAYGFGRSILRSTDDGESWQSLQLDELRILTGDLPLPDGRLGLVGDAGFMLTVGGSGGVEVSRPLGQRVFLSEAVTAGDGSRIFATEQGIHRIEVSP